MGSSGRLIEARGMRRRLQALAARGWSQQRLGEQLGIARTSVQPMFEYRMVRMTRHLEVVALYERLWNVAPPLVTRPDRSAAGFAMRAARFKGWAPPMAWDDIDEDESPAIPDVIDEIDEVAVQLAVAGERVRVTPAERRAAVRILNARDMDDGDVAERLNINVRTVFRIREELGLAACLKTTRERVAA